MQDLKQNLILPVIAFLGLFVSPLMAEAKDIAFRCRSVYANPSDAAVTVYTGVLVERADGKQELIYLPNRWGPGHLTALIKLRIKDDETNPVMKTLWMGELSLREKPGTKTVLVAVNDISGTYYESTKSQFPVDDIPYQNDVQAMRDFMGTHDVWDSSQTKYVPFKENQSHLDWASEYLKREVELSNTAHDIEKIFSNTDMVFQELLKKNGSDYEKTAPELERALKKYIVVMETLGYEHKFQLARTKKIIELSNYFLAIKRAPPYTLMIEFLELHKAFLQMWHDYSNELGRQAQMI